MKGHEGRGKTSDHPLAKFAQARMMTMKALADLVGCNRVTLYKMIRGNVISCKMMRHIESVTKGEVSFKALVSEMEIIKEQGKMTDKILRWKYIEAPTSWHTATGRSGGYTITCKAHDEFVLSYPGGGLLVCHTAELAKLHAQCNELTFCLANPDTPEPMREFWMVHGVGTDAPRVRHEYEDQATIEAKRLAKLHPGIRFVVLKAVNAFECPATEPSHIVVRPPTKQEIDDDGLPF